MAADILIIDDEADIRELESRADAAIDRIGGAAPAVLGPLALTATRRTR